MGGQVGTEVEVAITGESIDDASELVFSHPGITATAVIGADGKAVPKKYLVKISEDCPIGVHEARLITPLGLSASRIFSVGHLTEVVHTEPSTTPDNALPLSLDSICNAVIPVRAVNHYRLTAKKHQRILVDCTARGIDSKLYPVVTIADSTGRDLLVERRGDLLNFTAPQDDQYLIKVHDLTFQGGPEFFYRLAVQQWPTDQPSQRMASTAAVHTFSWPPAGVPENAAMREREPNGDGDEPVQPITLPCDIAGSFFPAADVDVFEFMGKKGEVWWVEVASERLGLPTDPSILVQRVVEPTPGSGESPTLVDVTELSDIPSPVKVSSNNYAYDGPPYNAGSTDVLGKVEIPEDGKYRLQLLDLFGGTRNDARNRYRLIIRQAEPDFALVAWALHMELRNGDRNALSKPMSLRPGATMALEVIAIRRDGFDGDIDLAMQNLPDGVTAQGLRIPAGQSRGIMLVSADAQAPAGHTSANFEGRAEINGVVVSRPCRLASMAWPVKDAWSEIPSPRLLIDVPVSVGNAEVAPLTIQTNQDKPFEVTVGQSVTIPLVHFRRSEFSGATMSMKIMGHGFEHHPTLNLPLDKDHSEAVLDLAKLQTTPGDYWIALYGSAVAKYSHEAIAMKTAQSDAVKSAAVSKPTTEDIVDIVVSKPIAIRVHPVETK